MQAAEHLDCKQDVAEALGCCFRNSLSSIKSSKTTQGSEFGVFSIGVSAGWDCRREAAHFQGLCEQEGQLLEFEAASSTKFVLAVLSLPGQGRGTSWLSAFLLQYV